MKQNIFCWFILVVVFTVNLVLADGVEVTEKDDVVSVKVGGELFTEYHYKDADRPYFYPLMSADGVNITRHWPMKDGVEGEQTDHEHHRSLWFTHGDVNGLDFWSEGKGPKIILEKLTKVSSGKDFGVIEAESKWVDANGKTVCTDLRKHTIHKGTKDTRIIDFEITIKASHGKLVLGDTKEGSMAVRVASTMRVRGKVAKGHILNSEGVKDKQAWGKRAKWCDAYGPVEGKMVGVAIFDHADNPRNPTWWHARDYGLITANPFGIHYFEKNPSEEAGDMTVEAGESVTFKYRVVIHSGVAEKAKIEKLYSEYIGK